MEMNSALSLLAKKYKIFFEQILMMHGAISDHIGHSLDHTLMVAQYALLIAENPNIGELAWLAGLLHNMDRISDDPGHKVDILLLLLPAQYISRHNIDRIKHAVKHHMDLNSQDDDDVLVTLKDADRLANIGPLNLIRGGQHHWDIPAITLGVYSLHPESTYKKPISVLDSIHYNLEWEDMLRLPKAIAIGKKQFDYYRDFLVRNHEQFAEVGLDEWPIDIGT